MEGALSLMQMAKVSRRSPASRPASLHLGADRSDDGGVTASFAMLGDLNIAEPKALIGFAGLASSSRRSDRSYPRDSSAASSSITACSISWSIVETWSTMAWALRFMRARRAADSGVRAGAGARRHDASTSRDS